MSSRLSWFIASLVFLSTGCSLAFSGDRYTGGQSVDVGPREDARDPATDAHVDDVGTPTDVFVPVDAAVVACSEEEPCDEGSFCHEGTCVGCDADRDGYAHEDAPASCLGAGIQPGDCEPSLEEAHPWALPDCAMGPVAETCGTGEALFSPQGFEAGYVRFGLMGGITVRDLHVFPLRSDDRDVRLLVVFRTSESLRPMHAILDVAVDGDVTVAAMGEIPSWGFGTTAPVSSRLAAARSVSGHITVVSVEADDAGVLSMWGAHLAPETTTWDHPIGKRRLLGPTGVTQVNGLSVSFDDTARPMGLASLIAGGAVTTVTFGVDLGDERDVTADFFVEATGAHSGSSGGALIDRAVSQFRVWDGSFPGRFATLDSGSAEPGAYASSWDDGSNAIVVAPGGGDILNVRQWQCPAITTAACTVSGPATVAFATDASLLSADWLFSSAYMVAGRNFAGSLTLGALSAGSGSLELRTHTFADVMPTSWDTTDVGARLDFVSGAGAATVAVAMSAASGGVELVVMRACFTP